MNNVASLRMATSSDAPFLLGLFAETRSRELKHVPWSEEQKFAFVQMQFRAQQADYESRYVDSLHSVIVIDGAPVGRIWVDDRKDEIRILDLAVLTEARGAGVGSAVLSRVLAQASAVGKQVRGYVDAAEGSRAWFERRGFRLISDEGAAELIEWSPQTDHLSLEPVVSTDDDFLFQLFTDVRAEPLLRAGLEPSQIEALLRTQFDGQRKSYTANYPKAQHHVIVHAAKPIGRLMVDATAGSILLVDISLLSNTRGQGFGTNLIVGLMGQAHEQNVPLKLSVARDNRAVNLYRRLAFVECGGDDVYLNMEWRSSQ